MTEFLPEEGAQTTNEVENSKIQSRMNCTMETVESLDGLFKDIANGKHATLSLQDIYSVKFGKEHQARMDNIKMRGSIFVSGQLGSVVQALNESNEVSSTSSIRDALFTEGQEDPAPANTHNRRPSSTVVPGAIMRQQADLDE